MMSENAYLISILAKDVDSWRNCPKLVIKKRKKNVKTNTLRVFSFVHIRPHFRKKNNQNGIFSFFFFFFFCKSTCFGTSGSILEELVSKTSYIHSHMLLICSLGHSKETNFPHNLLQMENVDTS